MTANTPTFKKCDLHVHSSSCYSRSYSKEDFLNRIIESDLDVVAITDHNTVDTDLMDEVNDIFLSKKKILIAGVEINVKLKENTIEQYGLEIKEETGREYFHGIIWCSYSDCKEFGSAIDKMLCKAKIIEQNDLDKIERNEITRKKLSEKTEGKAVFLEDLQESLSAIPHFFVLHENKGSRNLSDYLPNTKSNNQEYKQKLLYYCHAMAVEGGETSRKKVSVYFKEKLHETLAALFFSDARVLFPEDKKDSNDIAIGERYTWIDFDGDLDSLLLAISDPSSRIRTSDTCPNNPQNNRDNYLESLSFDLLSNNGSKRITQSFNFAPGFNGIVGARGSGKSMLARLLTKQSTEDYAAFVDQDTIMYRMSNEPPTSNPPKFIYLKQGELEGIFENQNYSDIPFLKDRIKEIESEAVGVSNEAFDEIVQQLNLQNELTMAYAEKYPTGSISIDILDNNPPSGLLVEFPKISIVPDVEKISEMKSSLNAVNNSLLEIIQNIKKIQPISSYPENAELFSLFFSSIRTSEKQTEQAQLSLSNLLASADKIQDEWFDERKRLTKEFTSSIGVFNDQQDSVALSKYTKTRNSTTLFLEHLLRLRLSLKDSDSIINEKFETMLTPIPPVEAKIEEEKFKIIISYDGISSYEEFINHLLKEASRKQGDHIVRACLSSSEPEKIKGIFNGNRIKRQPDASFKDFICGYYSCLSTDISNCKKIKREILLDEKPLDNMSPGMRAEALLKLFLQNEIANNEYTFVVLDQPEDNLDTNTISRFLITRLKQLKLNVQFFIVSHSAPIIVNGDARNVIVCKASNDEINYEYGVINGELIKQDISTVLDGGEEYLKMRLNKYNFKIGDER